MEYPHRWFGVWAIVSATGVGLGLMQWRWSTVLFAFVGTAAAMTSLIVAASDVPDGASQLSALTWRVVRVGVEMAAATVAFVAVVCVSKTFAISLLAAAVASSPWVVGRVLRLVRRVRPQALGAPYSELACAEPPPEPASASLPDVDVAGMTTAELCQAWRRSFLLLDSASSTLERSRIVGCRQLYLDELERRCPSGLRAWLASGARAAGSPQRYVGDDPARGHPDAA